ncbi:MAG: FliI/YscN family ATPase [Deltaproteobacteria bacterium]|nr:FliI/YscN family ATPase [Deltaproteobacteria bacterium]
MSLPWAHIDQALSEVQPISLSGRVVRVSGLVVEGTLPRARLGMLCRLMVRGDDEGVPAEVVALREDTCSLMPLRSVSGITAGTPIEPLETSPAVPVSYQLIGRVVDAWGNPIDGGKRIRALRRYPLQPGPLNPMERTMVERPLPMGITAIDTLLTCGEGQRIVIMAGAGVGKSTLLGMLAKNSDADVTIIALIGERSREVKRFVVKELGPRGLEKAVVVSATSDTAVALRIRAAYAATALAEYFRDEGKRVLLLMDSLTRVCMAQRELGLATGEPPTTRGYPPSAFAIIPRLLERAGQGTGEGSITAFYTALLEGDDTNDPIGDAVRAVTDGHIVLSRSLAERGHFPAIDVLASTSRVMPDVVDAAHRRAAATVRRTLADLREAQELVSFGAYRQGEVARFDRALGADEELRDLLTQASEGERRPLEAERQKIIQLAQKLEPGRGAGGGGRRAGEGADAA